MGPKHLKILAGIALFLGSLSLPAGAQQSSLVPSATTPGHLRWFPETQVQWTPLRDGETLNEIKQHFTLGLWGKSAVTGMVHLRGGKTETALIAKHRFYQNDFGSVDTLRLAAIGGLRQRNRGDASGLDPELGIASNWIQGRWGWNSALIWQSIGEDHLTPQKPEDLAGSLLRFDQALLWRMFPAEYGAKLQAATYLTLESNVWFGGSDNQESRLGLGILYEAPAFALELVATLPFTADLEGRPERGYGIVAGLRLLF
jgi:hypothetical protein